MFASEVAFFIGANAWNLIFAISFIVVAIFTKSITKNVGKEVAKEMLFPAIITIASSFGLISQNISEGTLHYRSMYQLVGFFISVIALYTVISLRNHALKRGLIEERTVSEFIICMACGNSNNREQKYCTACGTHLNNG